MPFGRIESFLLQLRARDISINLVEVERRLACCRKCGHWEGCNLIATEQWLPLLTTGGPSEAAELCEAWKP